MLPDLPDDGPVITGGFPRYHIGDKVNVNCTSYRSKPAAKLRWYINGEQADFALTKNYPVTHLKIISCNLNYCKDILIVKRYVCIKVSSDY